MQYEIIEKCRHLLAEGDTEQAVALLKEHRIGKDSEHIQWSGRLNNLKQKSSMGLVTADFVTMEENRIRHDVLQHLNALREKDSVPSLRRNTMVFGAAAILLLSMAVFVVMQLGGNNAAVAKTEVSESENAVAPSQAKPDTTQGLTAQTPKQRPAAPAEEERPTTHSEKQKVKPPKPEPKPTQEAQAVFAKESPLKSASQACMNSIAGYDPEKISHLLDLGECLFNKGHKSDGINMIAKSFKISEYHAKGYEVLCQYLIKYEDKALAKTHLGIFEFGLRQTKGLAGYDLVHQRILTAKDKLVAHFSL